MAIDTKPAERPRWATDVSAAVETPISGKQDIGWEVEKPPHEYWNWLQKFNYLWLQFLESRISNATTSVVTASGTAAVSAISQTIAANATLGNQTFTLPSAASNPEMIVCIKKTDASVNTVTVSAASDLIDQATTVVLALRNQSVTVIALNSTWHIIARRDYPLTAVGDLLVGTTAGAPSRLAIGAVNTLPISTGTTLAYRQLLNADVDAAAAITGAKIVAADTATAGVMSAAAQSISGVKKFLDGISNLVTVSTTNTNITLSNTDPRSILYNSFSANRSVTLPTTSILIGEMFFIANSSALRMTILASNASELTVANSCNIGGSVDGSGHVRLQALQNTPTTPAHWRVIEVFSTKTLNISSSGNFNAAQPVLTISKMNNVVTLTFPTLVHASGSGPLSATSFIPAPYLPATDTYNVTEMSAGRVVVSRVTTAGEFGLVYRDWAGTSQNNTTALAGSLSWGTNF